MDIVILESRINETNNKIETNTNDIHTIYSKLTIILEHIRDLNYYVSDLKDRIELLELERKFKQSEEEI